MSKNRRKGYYRVKPRDTEEYEVAFWNGSGWIILCGGATSFRDGYFVEIGSRITMPDDEENENEL